LIRLGRGGYVLIKMVSPTQIEYLFCINRDYDFPKGIHVSVICRKKRSELVWIFVVRFKRHNDHNRAFYLCFTLWISTMLSWNLLFDHFTTLMMTWRATAQKRVSPSNYLRNRLIIVRERLTFSCRPCSWLLFSNLAMVVCARSFLSF